MIVGVVLIPMLAVLGMTIVFFGQALPAHLFVGMLLISPVGLKMATSG